MRKTKNESVFAGARSIRAINAVKTSNLPRFHSTIGHEGMSTRRAGSGKVVASRHDLRRLAHDFVSCCASRCARVVAKPVDIASASGDQRTGGLCPAVSGGLQRFGAGEGNRTLVCSLGSCRSTIELRPPNYPLKSGTSCTFWLGFSFGACCKSCCTVPSLRIVAYSPPRRRAASQRPDLDPTGRRDGHQPNLELIPIAGDHWSSLDIARAIMKTALAQSMVIFAARIALLRDGAERGREKPLGLLNLCL